MILTTVSFDRDSLLVDLKNRINVLEAMDTVFSTVKKMQKMAAEQSRAEKQILIIIKSDEFIRGLALGPDPTIKR